jgi:hypothetical protein
MNEQYINLGATFVLALGLIELLKYALTLLSRKKNGNNYSKEVSRELSVISENHLNSIEGAIKEQTRNSTEWNTKIYQTLCEIKGILQNSPR